VGKIILAAGQFAQCPALNETLLESGAKEKTDKNRKAGTLPPNIIQDNN